MEGDVDYYDESAVNCQPDLIYYTKAYEYIYNHPARVYSWYLYTICCCFGTRKCLLFGEIDLDWSCQ